MSRRKEGFDKNGILLIGEGEFYNGTGVEKMVEKKPGRRGSKNFERFCKKRAKERNRDRS